MNAWEFATPETQELIKTLKTIELDFVGWDIYKFIQLLAKSNPTSLEWLFSPTVYIENSIRQELQAVGSNFSRYALFMHYKSLAYSNYRRYIQDLPSPSAKKYLYVIRGMLAAIYILEFSEFPPLNFKKLVSSLRNEKYWGVGTMAASLDELIISKQSGDKMGGYKIGPDLTYWVAETFTLLDEKEARLKDKPSEEINKDILENILASVLK